MIFSSTGPGLMVFLFDVAVLARTLLPLVGRGALYWGLKKQSLDTSSGRG